MSIETISAANPEWEFGDRLRKVRRSVAGLSQHEMAAAIGITQKAYDAWENGRNRPGDIVAVAKHIESLWPGRVTSAWLLGIGDGEPTPPRPPGAIAPRRDEPVVRHLRPIANEIPVGEVSEEALAYLKLADADAPVAHPSRGLPSPLETRRSKRLNTRARPTYPPVDQLMGMSHAA